MEPNEILIAVKRMSKDIKVSSKLMSKQQVRFLVDAYYQMQEDRIRGNARLRSMTEEPNNILEWLTDQSETLENQIKIALDVYTYNLPIGQWCRSITGIGPVITAGLVSHFDIHKAPTVGNFWVFAGLDPTIKWEKGQKRPWNAFLKSLICFKLGECFVKVQNNEKDVYGKIYAKRKLREIERNNTFEFAPLAKIVLDTKKIDKSTEAYKHYMTGKLPPAHIHARARRYAVKIFISHLHEVWYEIEFGRKPDKPISEEHINNPANFIPIPNWPMNQSSG